MVGRLWRTRGFRFCCFAGFLGWAGASGVVGLSESGVAGYRLATAVHSGKWRDREIFYVLGVVL
jgi:hypothetical protein